ncbi:MAG: HAMP domain-containing histidine kinase [Lachnospiraceae bacterium]|nr:HAMP domain-containing histidine kinase [Lachnospiraceae bacterium]
MGVFGIYVVSMSEMLSVSSLLRFAKGSFFLILHGTLALLLDLAFLFFYGSLVRRIKAGILLKGSLIGKLWQALKRACVRIKKGMWWVYRNAGVTGKTILRFIPIFILMHLHLLAGMWESAAMLIFCWLLDVLLFVMLLYNAAVTSRIVGGIDKISSGELEYQVDTGHIYGDNLQLANAVNHIGDGIRQAVEQSMKDERMKADLITNVSHDIKTPLTSIINYVDLLKREHVEDETIRGYIEVLDSKSQRLKQLTDDLVEASKISSGNIVLHMEQLNVVELMQQALGEFTDRFAEKQLSLITDFPDTPCMIHADSRRMWRVIDNLLGNIYKYSMENTRVYMEVKDLSSVGNQVSISIKNISKQPLNIDAEELTERFIRGDVSRSTEGSGLGLSIAKNLVEAQGGEFRLYLDGDLFKVIMQF